MKILSVSDHIEPILYKPGSHKNFSNIDIILSCGDLPADYLTYLVTVFNVPLFYIKGNHDEMYALNPPQGCVDVHGKVVVYKGVRILGLEGSRWYNGGRLQYTERQMAWMVMKTKLKLWWYKGVDIIITHAPPRHIHDKKDICHRGFKCFRGLIDRYSPSFFLHGHIHACFKNTEERKTVINKTKVINTFRYHIIEYKK